ncbi:MAG: outer membrane lipoprotein carrier protein LolA [Rhodospirillales bacterium]|nr:outer membrane lipoprotein carrier protein LolA [Alphaproteobacteria bacterium]MCB9986912.1 outer membrane lipoprotein carrier protein LolA [Rhodospirillales bacterium]USO08311.1 MAG: outer membrane lipoprotein carrier protein LolA [Rhodospirillales bacterium]
MKKMMKNVPFSFAAGILAVLLAWPACAQDARRSYPETAAQRQVATQATQIDAREYVRKAEDWLRNLKTGRARFVQQAYDGSTAAGTFYISRPGRLRFEYDPPAKDFVVADGVFIYFYDAQQRQTSTAPIGTTLADFLLRKKASLSGDVTVRAVREHDGVVSIAMVQTKNPDAGQLTVDFTLDPFMLRSWSVVDAQGLTTRMTLSDLQLGVPVPPQYFVYKDPTGRTRLNN